MPTRSLGEILNREERAYALMLVVLPIARLFQAIAYIGATLTGGRKSSLSP